MILACALLSAGARLLVSADDQMAWRTLVWAVRGLGDRRLTRLLTAGEATFIANLRRVAESDAACRRAVDAGDAVIEQLGRQEEVEPGAIVDILVDRLGCGPVDRTGVDAVRGETAAAPPREWLQQVFGVSEPTQAKPDEVPDAIPVYTIFGAKGLQAPVVLLVNAIEQSFAGRGALEDGIRRAYVGVTRARDHLLISAPLYLRGSSLEHTVGTRAGGLAQIVVEAADHAGIDVETIRPADL